MSLSAAQAAAFVSEAKESGSVWAIRDAGGYPAPMNAEGSRAMPFWSKRSRVEKIINSVPAYGGFEPEEIVLGRWLEWLPGLEKDGLEIGLNWYGKRVTGYHLQVQDVLARFGKNENPSPPPRAEAESASVLSRVAAWFSPKP